MVRTASTVTPKPVILRVEKGAKAGLITSEGFRDVLEMRRIRVPRLYDPLYEKPPALSPRKWRYEVRERLDHKGNVLTALGRLRAGEPLGRVLRDLPHGGGPRPAPSASTEEKGA